MDWDLPAVTVMLFVIAAREADFRVRLSKYPVPGDKRDKRIGYGDVAGPGPHYDAFLLVPMFSTSTVSNLL